MRSITQSHPQLFSSAFEHPLQGRVRHIFRVYQPHNLRASGGISQHLSLQSLHALLLESGDPLVLLMLRLFSHAGLQVKKELVVSNDADVLSCRGVQSVFKMMREAKYPDRKAKPFSKLSLPSFLCCFKSAVKVTLICS